MPSRTRRGRSAPATTPSRSIAVAAALLAAWAFATALALGGVPATADGAPAAQLAHAADRPTALDRPADATAARRCRRGRRASCPVRALVLGRASSPALGALRRRLGGRIALRRSARVPKRLRRPGRFDLLVLDGDALTARRIRRSQLLGRFVAARRWVLALDVRAAHHRRALSEHTGLGLGRPGGSRAFLFRHARVARGPVVSIVDVRRLAPQGLRRVGKRRRLAGIRRETRRVAGLIARRVAARARAAGGPLGSAPGVPAEAQRIVWNYTQTGSAHPPSGYYTKGKKIKSAVIKRHPAPAPGKQTATWTVNHAFAAYLDNAEHPDGNFQVVTYDLAGTFAPKRGDEKFFHMFDPWKVGVARQSLERAWWTGLIEPSVDPRATAATKLAWQANEPQTANTTTKYTSGQSFKVGISASTEKAASASASYSISSEEEHDIPDWGVASDTSGDTVGWTFSSRNCDPRSSAEGGSGWKKSCFDFGLGKPATPKEPNGLSRGQSQFHASARWVTQRDGRNAVLGEGDGRLAFDVKVPITLVDTYCDAWGLLACASNGHQIKRTGSGPKDTTYTVDASDVLPRKIEAVRMSPNPADGSQAENVTGTVVLAEPVPFETTLVVFSNEDQAVVGSPLSDKVSRAHVTVPAGKSRGTFTVETNDNSLAKGEHVTATITIFYAGTPHPKRLCVVTTPDGSCTS